MVSTLKMRLATVIFATLNYFMKSKYNKLKFTIGIQTNSSIAKRARFSHAQKKFNIR